MREHHQHHALTVLDKAYEKMIRVGLWRALNRWKDLISDLLAADREKQHRVARMVNALRYIMLQALAQAINKWKSVMQDYHAKIRDDLRVDAHNVVAKRCAEANQQHALEIMNKTIDHILHKQLAKGMQSWKQIIYDLLQAERKKEHLITVMVKCISGILMQTYSKAFHSWYLSAKELAEAERLGFRNIEDKVRAMRILHAFVERLQQKKCMMSLNKWKDLIWDLREKASKQYFALQTMDRAIIKMQHKHILLVWGVWIGQVDAQLEEERAKDEKMRHAALIAAHEAQAKAHACTLINNTIGKLLHKRKNVATHTWKLGTIGHRLMDQQRYTAVEMMGRALGRIHHVVLARSWRNWDAEANARRYEITYDASEKARSLHMLEAVIGRLRHKTLSRGLVTWLKFIHKNVFFMQGDNHHRKMEALRDEYLRNNETKLLEYDASEKARALHMLEAVIGRLKHKTLSRGLVAWLKFVHKNVFFMQGDKHHQKMEALRDEYLQTQSKSEEKFISIHSESEKARALHMLEAVIGRMKHKTLSRGLVTWLKFVHKDTFFMQSDDHFKQVQNLRTQFIRTMILREDGRRKRRGLFTWQKKCHMFHVVAADNLQNILDEELESKSRTELSVLEQNRKHHIRKFYLYLCNRVLYNYHIAFNKLVQNVASSKHISLAKLKSQHESVLRFVRQLREDMGRTNCRTNAPEKRYKKYRDFENSKPPKIPTGNTETTIKKKTSATPNAKMRWKPKLSEEEGPTNYGHDPMSLRKSSVETKQTLINLKRFGSSGIPNPSALNLGVPFALRDIHSESTSANTTEKPFNFVEHIKKNSK